MREPLWPDRDQVAGGTVPRRSGIKQEDLTLRETQRWPGFAKKKSCQKKVTCFKIAVCRAQGVYGSARLRANELLAQTVEESEPQSPKAAPAIERAAHKGGSEKSETGRSGIQRDSANAALSNFRFEQTHFKKLPERLLRTRGRPHLRGRSGVQSVANGCVEDDSFFQQVAARAREHLLGKKKLKNLAGRPPSRVCSRVHAAARSAVLSTTASTRPRALFSPSF